MSNKGMKLKRWLYRTVNKNGVVYGRSVRAYTRENADKKMREWSKEDGFKIIQFVGDDLTASV